MSIEEEFISKIAPLVQKYAPKYGICVCSPIIAQACLESAYGKSSLADAFNYFGLKWRNNRCAVSNEWVEKPTFEQKTDGSYYQITSKFMKFHSVEEGVEGYFQWTNISNYSNLKGVTDPRTYLENIKADKYATSLKYVDNNMNVIKKWNLTQYDNTTPKEDTTEISVTTLLADKSNYGSTRDVSSIKYIVMHYTANDGDRAVNNAKYFATGGRNASAHYFVDDDSIYQSVPDNYVAWSVGGKKYASCATSGGGTLYGIATNNNTINIEMCDTVKDGQYNLSMATRNNASDLVAYLMKKYNIPIDNVIRHFDVVGKQCPRYWATKDNLDFLAFRNEVSAKLGGEIPTPVTPTTPKANIFYQVKRNEVFDYREVKNNEGYVSADNLKVSDVAVRVDRGTIEYQVHVCGQPKNKWLPYVTGYNWFDANNGYAGNGKPIDGFRIRGKGLGGDIKYRVSVVGTPNWLPVVTNDSDYAGIYGKIVDKLQIWIE